MSLRARQRIRRIVFTDSSHPSDMFDLKIPQFKAWLLNKERVINYVPSAAPVGTVVKEWETVDEITGEKKPETAENKQCCCLSAGVDDHASMNNALVSEIFNYLTGPCPEWDDYIKNTFLYELEQEKIQKAKDMVRVNEIRARQEMALDRWQQERIAKEKEKGYS